MKHIAGALCAYEVAAIWTGRVPTLTALSARYPSLRIVLLAALGVHLYYRKQVIP